MTPTVAQETSLGYSCPRYERCNAPYCPGLGGKHLAGEPVCFYMREAVKEGGMARVGATLPHELAGVVLGVAKRLLDGSGPLPRALRGASRTGSKIEQGIRAAGNLYRRTAT